MADPSGLKIPESVHRAAGRWLVRRARPGGPHDDEAFLAWLAADPAHRVAYHQAERLWRESRLLEDMPTGQARRLAKAPLLMRRNVQASLAGVAVVIALGFVTVQMTGLAPRVSIGTKVQAATYETSLGEIRTYTLADGSRVTLDTNSRVRVSLSASECRVVLERGRARFDVGDPGSRTFTVITRAGRISAKGGTFEVSDIGRGVRVAALAGEAAIDDRVSGKPEIALRAGQQLDLGSGADPAPIGTDQAQWARGILTLDQTPLGDAVASINRYNPVKVALAAPDLAERSISGGFDVHDPAAFARAAASALGLVVSRPDARTLLLARPSASTPR